MDWGHLPGGFGWIGFYDRIAQRLPDYCAAVELGVFMGRSLTYLAGRLKASGKHFTLYAVDTWSVLYRGPEPEHSEALRSASRFGGDRYATFLDNMHRCGLSDNVRPVREVSWQAASHFPDGSVDFAFIDADPAYGSVVRDIEAWLPKMKPNGILAGHDYDPAHHGGVVRAVDELFPNRFTLEEGNVWCMDLELTRRLRGRQQASRFAPNSRSVSIVRACSATSTAG